MQTQEDREVRGEENTITRWTMLPSDILQTIANMLWSVNVIGYIRLRAVCKSWRSAIVDPPPQLPILPWIMLSYDESTTSNARTFYLLGDGNTLTLDLPEDCGRRIVGSDDGWLVLAYRDSVVRLFDPITRAQILLPPLTTSPQIQELLQQALDFIRVDLERVRRFGLRKAIIVQSKHSTVTYDHQIGMVIAILDLGWATRLAFIRPGDSCWTMFMSETAMFMSNELIDVLPYRGQVYALAHAWGPPWIREGTNGLVVFRGNIDPPCKVMPIACVEGDISTWYWYLVESSGDLLVVGRKYSQSYPNDITEGFDIYRLVQSDAEAKLVKVTSLGDCMLFLGLSRSLSLSATDFPGWKGNCIYFTPNCYPDCPGFDEFGVYDLDDGSIKPLPCYPDTFKKFWHLPIWFTPSQSREKDGV